MSALNDMPLNRQNKTLRSPLASIYPVISRRQISLSKHDMPTPHQQQERKRVYVLMATPQGVQRSFLKDKRVRSYYISTFYDEHLGELFRNISFHYVISFRQNAFNATLQKYLQFSFIIIILKYSLHVLLPSIGFRSFIF